jgi:hypothetical protein
MVNKKKHKLGVAYNVFDGEELLIHSINQIKEYVDYIVVVAQEKSNFGNVNTNLRNTLKKLQDLDLIHYVYWYEPKFEYESDGTLSLDNGVKNEQRKRQIGLELCKDINCTIFSSMDCDEIYDKDEYEFAKNDFIKGNYDSSFCQMKTFYKKTTFEVTPPETYYVPLFYKVNENSNFTFDFVPPYPVQIDPSRRMKAGDCRIYTRNEIQMYHYSYVRADIHSKINNSSSSARINDLQKQTTINHFNKCNKVSDGAMFLNNCKFELIEVENKFNIEL